MILQQIYDTLVNGAFQQRVRAAIVKAAEQIVGEDWQTAGFSQTKANKRHQVDVRVLDGGGSIVSSWINAIAANIGEVADPSTLSDADISNAISSLWDDMAGVMFGE